jgi:sporulation protein YlmC with PRC-barrel domain
LYPLSELQNYTIQARDGEVGSLADVYFERDTWAVRYLVVEVGGWLSRQQLLLIPAVVEGVDRQAAAIQVSLTRSQVKNSPDVDSARELTGYAVRATDGAVGRVDDVLLDTESWQISYLVVGTGDWLAGRQVLISPAWIDAIRWASAEVDAGLTRAGIESSPPYDPADVLGAEYRRKLAEHHGREHSP